MSTEPRASSPYATVGLIAGGIALLLAVLHFWAGPFGDDGTVEGVASRITEMRDAVVSAIRGERSSPGWLSSLDIDRVVRITAAMLAAIALVLAVTGYAREENRRVAIGAAALGSIALMLQFAIAALSALLLVALIGFAISRIDLGCCCCD